MANENIQGRSYLKFLLIAALVGLCSALITFAFIYLVDIGQSLLWEQAAQTVGLSAPIFTLIVCSIGGLLVGILVSMFGDFSGIFADLLVEFRQTGRFNYRNAPAMILMALVSLIFGGSLGPEAPMADASGGVGTWLADRLKMNDLHRRSLGFSGISGMLAAFITSPFGGALLGLEATGGSFSIPWALFPSLVSSAVATTVFVMLSGSYFGHLFVFPAYTVQVRDLFLAIPLGLAGALAGAVFIIAYKRLHQLMQLLKGHLVIRGLIGGLGMGIAGALLPLTLFSGEDQTITVIEQSAELGVVTLIILALVKLLVTSLLLATGWKGGYIFPTMFAGVSLGMAIHLIFPGIPVAVAVGATLGGAMVSTLKAPIFSALFAAILVERQVAPTIAIAVIVGLLATMRISFATPADDEEAIEDTGAQTEA